MSETVNTPTTQKSAILPDFNPALAEIKKLIDAGIIHASALPSIAKRLSYGQKQNVTHKVQSRLERESRHEVALWAAPASVAGFITWFMTTPMVRLYAGSRSTWRINPLPSGGFELTSTSSSSGASHSTRVAIRPPGKYDVTYVNDDKMDALSTGFSRHQHSLADYIRSLGCVVLPFNRVGLDKPSNQLVTLDFAPRGYASCESSSHGYYYYENNMNWQEFNAPLLFSVNNTTYLFDYDYELLKLGSVGTHLLEVQSGKTIANARASLYPNAPEAAAMPLVMPYLFKKIDDEWLYGQLGIADNEALVMTRQITRFTAATARSWLYSGLMHRGAVLAAYAANQHSGCDFSDAYGLKKLKADGIRFEQQLRTAADLIKPDRTMRKLAGRLGNLNGDDRLLTPNCRSFKGQELLLGQLFSSDAGLCHAIKFAANQTIETMYNRILSTNDALYMALTAAVGEKIYACGAVCSLQESVTRMPVALNGWHEVIPMRVQHAAGELNKLRTACIRRSTRTPDAYDEN